MSNRGFWRIAAGLAAGVIAVACGSPSESSQSSDSAQTECAASDPICSGGAACVASGQACSGDTDCCSGSCNAGGLCSAEAGASDSGAAAVYCSPAGATCAGADECCSGICNGTCASGNADSDSGADGGLTPPPTPTPVPVPQCTGSGDDCNSDNDCCSKQCWFSTCILG